MKFKAIVPQPGDYIVVSSDNWLVFDGDGWREMTFREQIEASN